MMPRYRKQRRYRRKGEPFPIVPLVVFFALVLSQANMAVITKWVVAIFGALLGLALLVVVVKLCIRRSNARAHQVSSAKDIHAADTLPRSIFSSEHYPLRSDHGIVENDLGNEAVADEYEAKNYKGWIFANAASPRWTASYPNGKKFQFQNPVRQNFKHLCVISEKTGIGRDLLIPIVAFGSASDFKTEIPVGVMHYQDVPSFIRSFSTVKIKPSQLPEIVDVFREWNNAVAPALKLNHVKNKQRRT